MTMERTDMPATPWYGAGFTAGRAAAALDWPQQAVVEAISSLVPYGASPSGTQMIGLAVAAALHLQAGIASAAATAIVRNRWRLCESIRATLDFVPSRGGANNGGTDERDPFMFFEAYASEALAVPAIDEFLDVMDGRRVVWRRPKRDAYSVACDLHRLSEALKSDDAPGLTQEYLDLLSSLRQPASQLSEWIGTVADGSFRPAPDRFAEPSPTMRQGLEIEADPSRFVHTYATCVSVNVSLAARCFKRRMLGLEVTDPFVGSPPARRRNEGDQVIR